MYHLAVYYIAVPKVASGKCVFAYCKLIDVRKNCLSELCASLESAIAYRKLSAFVYVICIVPVELNTRRIIAIYDFIKPHISSECAYAYSSQRIREIYFVKTSADILKCSIGYS